jgi:hypothetical protein
MIFRSLFSVFLTFFTFSYFVFARASDFQIPDDKKSSINKSAEKQGGITSQFGEQFSLIISAAG